MRGMRKDCVHISGLEVEGLHPRALMECALVCLRTGHRPLRAQPPYEGLDKPVSPFLPSLESSVQSRGNNALLFFLSDSATIRFIPRQQRPDDSRVLVRYRDASLSGTQLALLLCDPSTAAVLFVRRTVHDRSRAMNQ